MKSVLWLLRDSLNAGIVEALSLATSRKRSMCTIGAGITSKNALTSTSVKKPLPNNLNAMWHALA